MSKSLIYLITIFVLWMFFKFSNKSKDKTLAEKYTVEDYDKAHSGSGGTMVVHRGEFTPGGGFGTTEKSKTALGVGGVRTLYNGKTEAKM